MCPKFKDSNSLGRLFMIKNYMQFYSPHTLIPQGNSLSILLVGSLAIYLTTSKYRVYIATS